MTYKAYLSLIIESLRRHRQHFILASIGIITGITAFTFFLALSSGARQVILGEIFPVQTLEVEPKTLGLSLGPLQFGFGPDSLTQATVEKIEHIAHVAHVYPKMKMRAPMIGKGGKKYIGNDLSVEILADGIAPALVQKDIHPDYMFDDFEQTTTFVKCRYDAECGTHRYCFDAPVMARHFSNPNPGYAYCRHYIPAIVSNHLIEIFNGVVRRTHNFPKLNPQFIIGYHWDVWLGASMVGRAQKQKQYFHKAQLVGFSDQAMLLGMTLPLSYIQRFNAYYHGPSATEQFHSVIVTVTSKEHMAWVSKKIEDLGFAVKDNGAEQASFIILVVTLVFSLISLMIMSIAAINIMHVYFMLIYQRQTEIGLLRAIGASRNDIRWVILGEASLVGLCAGLIGILLAIGLGSLLDRVSDQYIPNFPYKPETYFSFDGTILFSGLFLAIAFCMIGAVLPANRAAKMDPARVLTGQ